MLSRSLTIVGQTGATLKQSEQKRKKRIGSSKALFT